MVIEFGRGRGEFGHEPELRLRTPDALKERGRDEETGTKEREVANEKGSADVEAEFDEDVDVMSTEDKAEGVTRICDCDMGVSENSDSLSAVT